MPCSRRRWSTGSSGPSGRPRWSPACRSPARHLLLAFLVGLLLVPVASLVSRGLMVLHRAVVTGLLCISRPRALRRQVEGLRDSRSRGPRASRRPSCTGSSATCTTAPSSGWCRSRSTSGCAERPDRHRSGRGEGDSSSTREPRPAWRWRSSATSCAGRCPRSSSTAGSWRPSRSIAGRCPVPDRRDQQLAAGRAAAAGRRAGRVLRGGRGPRERRQAQLGDALRGRCRRDPWAPRRRGRGRRRRRGGAHAGRRAGRAARPGRRRSTGRSRVIEPAGRPDPGPRGAAAGGRRGGQAPGVRWPALQDPR